MGVNEPVQEQFVYRLWQDSQIINRPLITIDGQELYVLELGVRNYDSGPDFKDGLIVLNGTLHRGDIEIHAQARDWFIHQHHLDPAYNHVILHVVTGECPSDFVTLRSDGTNVPSFNFDSILDPPAEKLEKEYPPAPERVCELSQCSRTEIFKILHRFGTYAWKIKCLRFRERAKSAGWDQAFWESFCESLGYGKNQIAFINLARRCTVERLQEFSHPGYQQQFDHLTTILLYSAGLMPKHAKIETKVARDFSRKYNVIPLKKQDWKFFRLRPQNFPNLRILAAALIFLRYGPDFSGYFATWFRTSLSLKHFLARLRPLSEKNNVDIDFWLNELDLNWNSSVALLGRDRLYNIGYNVVLPFMTEYFVHLNDLKRATLIRELAVQYPALSLTRYSRDLLDILTRKQGFEITNELYHQGLLYLSKYLCRTGLCKECLNDNDSLRNCTRY